MLRFCLILKLKDTSFMKTRKIALASILFAATTGAATATDTKFYDLSPEHFLRHNSSQAYASGVKGLSQAVPGRPTFGAGQVPTYLLPRELQWMNRPIDPSNGPNR